MTNEHKENNKLPDSTKPIYTTYRPEIDLGEYADGSRIVLPPYVDVDGVQVHPDRLEEYLKRRFK